MSGVPRAGSATITTVRNRAGRIAAGASDLEARLASFAGQNRLPGAAAGVVCGDELAWLAGAGFAETATRKATDPAMLYGIGSITKTFTGTAIMQLRDAGRLGLDDPAVTWLPELGSLASPFGPVEAVTIRRMLSHESGLPAEPPGTDWAVPAYQGAPDQTLRQAGEISVQFPPHARHAYSDLAYQWLGEIVTRASGSPYPEYVRQAILEPLGMTATGFPPLSAGLLARCATGYDWRGLSDDLNPAPPMPPVWAEGGLWSSVADLARWVSFQLRAYREPALTGQVLDARSLREMHKPRYLADDQWTQAWGISWCGTRQEEVTWIGHSGGIPGFTSTICFDPAAQVGAIVLVNGTIGSVSIGLELAAAARELTRDRRPAPGPPPAPAPANHRPLLGIYARADLGGWLLRLEWRDGQLTFMAAEAPGWHVILTPTADPDRFGIADGGSVPGGSVTFRRSAGGRVASAFFLDSTWIRLDRGTELFLNRRRSRSGMSPFRPPR
jgi:CubicO group peptidase (beta-lactamase class C family)